MLDPKANFQQHPSCSLRALPAEGGCGWEGFSGDVRQSRRARRIRAALLQLSKLLLGCASWGWWGCTARSAVRDLAQSECQEGNDCVSFLPEAVIFHAIPLSRPHFTRSTRRGMETRTLGAHRHTKASEPLGGPKTQVPCVLELDWCLCGCCAAQLLFQLLRLMNVLTTNPSPTMQCCHYCFTQMEK